MKRAATLALMVIASLPIAPRAETGSVTGSYGSKVGTLDVVQLSKTRVQVHLTVFWRDHSGEICSSLPFEKNAARYLKGACRIELRFVGPKVEVKQTGSDADCDFGAGVAASGTYLRRSSRPPKIACR